MARARVVLSGVAAALALATLAVRAQSSRLDVLANVGLPAVEEGVLKNDVSHMPQTAEALKRASMHTVLHGEGVGTSGIPYVRGRVLVKFRDGASALARTDAVSSASDSAVLSSRPTYADFDIVTLDPAE